MRSIPGASCVDASSGLTVKGNQVSWGCKAPDGVNSKAGAEAAWRADLERWEFRAPRSELWVWSFGMEYEYDLEEAVVRAGPGTNDFVLLLHRPTGLTVILRDGRHLAFLTGNVVDFPALPTGVTSADVLDVIPHKGLSDWRDRNPKPSESSSPFRWFVYRNPAR